jgi:isohexenylglutaconyl-CoA hydratase
MSHEPLQWYDEKADNPPWIRALAEVRMRATREGWCYQHVQAIIVAIDQYAEKALGNREFGTFLEMVNTTPQVVVAAVEGYAIAGGFGILCVSDVAICTEDAGFAMSETAIGIVPAQIAPFVANRIGVPQTRHLALTAARFKGPEALRLGIVHHLVKDQAALDARLEEILKQIDRCAPLANALTKAVVMRVGGEPLSSVLDFAADKFAEARRSPEAAEGLRAFAEKRPPKWVTE